MKLAELTLSDDRQRAFVVLRPSWLARKLGAPTLIVELEWDRQRGERGEWVSMTTKRKLSELEHGDVIRRALEARPLGVAMEIPFARVVSHEIAVR